MNLPSSQHYRRKPQPSSMPGRVGQLAGVVLLLFFFLVMLPVLGQEPPLVLTDLAEYRRALIARDDPKTEPLPTTASFREIWDHPAKFQGKRIQVDARIVRRFRQGAVGTFPPLVEAWAVTRTGDPFCWVYPAPKSDEPMVREPVRFVGTYLRRIRYQGGDVDRLAPLIVGPRPPTTAPSRADHPGLRPGFHAGDWILAIVAVLVVVGSMLWHHLRKPIPRTAVLEPGPAPLFEPPPADDSGRSEERPPDDPPQGQQPAHEG